MNNFLVAAYSLRIKKIYEDIKEKIPTKLQGSFLQNRKGITKFVMPLIKKAYNEGLEFAQVFSGYEDIENIDKKISTKKIKKLFENFFIRVKNAEKIYKLRIENLKVLNKIEKHKKKNIENGNLGLQYKSEYENAIKLAVNNIILNAGFVANFEIWEK